MSDKEFEKNISELLSEGKGEKYVPKQVKPFTYVGTNIVDPHAEKRYIQEQISYEMQRRIKKASNRLVQPTLEVVQILLSEKSEDLLVGENKDFYGKSLSTSFMWGIETKGNLTTYNSLRVTLENHEKRPDEVYDFPEEIEDSNYIVRIYGDGHTSPTIRVRMGNDESQEEFQKGITEVLGTKGSVRTTHRNFVDRHNR